MIDIKLVDKALFLSTILDILKTTERKIMIKKTWTLLILICLITCSSGCLSPNTLDLDEKISRLENSLLVNKNILDRMDHYQVPGLSIAVMNDFKLEWTRGYGVMELGGDQPVTPDTLFQAGSVAKLITTATALHYVEAGLLDLEADVNDYLVSWQVPENEFTAQADVTLRGLLTHTAGINQGLNRGYAPGEEVPTLLQSLNGEPPANTLPVLVDRTPGTQCYYSNGGFLVVVQLLEDVVGDSFQDITREALFGPLGMDSSTFEQILPEDLQSRAATPHGWDIETWWEAPGLIAETHIHDPGYGGLWTTSPDLARFGLEIMDAYQGKSDQILSQEMVQEIMTVQFEDVAMQAPYDVDMGIGFDLLHLGGETWLIFFGGSFPGYISVLLFQPDLGTGIAILTNSFTGYELIWEILYSYFYTYGIFPTTGQVLEMGYSILLLLATILTILWGLRKKKTSNNSSEVNELVQKMPAGKGRGLFQRIFALLAAGSVLVITFRFRGPWGGFQTYPLWKGAPVLTKGLLGTFFFSGIILVILTIQVWVKGLWTLRERIAYTLVSLGILGGMFLLRDLWEVMFWG